MKDLEEYLWNLTADDLKKLKKKLELTKVGSTKQDMIMAIMKFYQTPNWLEDYFSTLKGFDKEYATLIIQENFNPISSEVDELALKYNVKKDWYGRIEDNLKFIIKGRVLSVFRPTLIKLVPPLELEFHVLEDFTKYDEYVFIENSKNPIKKFDDFIMFINKNKVKATDKNGYASKSGILKFIKENNILETVRREGYDLESLKNQNDTVVVNGIVSILDSCNVIAIKDGYFVLGSNYSEYIKLSPIDKAKYLLNEYINSKINEIERLNNRSYKYDLPFNFSSPRNLILDFVKKMPINNWVDMGELKRFIRIKDMYFLRHNIGEVYEKDDYSNWYYTPSFYNLEYSFIDSVVMDYLGVLGILDVGIYGTYNDYGNRFYLECDYAKLTNFGAAVLGLTESFVEEDNIKTLIIAPNFEIVIEESPKRMEYELCFDRFLKKLMENEDQTIYKLDFSGVAKAYDSKDFSIFDYIVSECADIPENVRRQINEWAKTLGIINIRTVTILEAPESLLNELLKDSKIRAIEQKSNSKHVIVSSKKTNELKKIIESKEYFCKIDD